MNIQPGKLKKQRKHSKSAASTLGVKLAAVLKFACVLGAIGMVLNIYIYLNQKISETERAISTTKQQIERTEREIAQQRIRKEQYSAWPHIRGMIVRFNLGLREPAPGQVAKMALLTPQMAAGIPLETAQVNVAAPPVPRRAVNRPARN